MALISEKTVAIVEGVAAEAQRIETPCGDGSMVWRVWGSGPPLVLLHGGYGSWMHWIRNVLVLAREFTVIAPDLPGLGESATPPEPHTAEAMAQIIVDGLATILPGRERLHLAIAWRLKWMANASAVKISVPRILASCPSSRPTIASASQSMT